MTGSITAIGLGLAVIGAGLGIGWIGSKAMEAIANWSTLQQSSPTICSNP